MSISNKVFSILPVAGLAAFVFSHDAIDEKPKTLADWGVPSTTGITPSLVIDYLQNQKFGEQSITKKFYNIGRIEVVEYSSDGKIYRITVKRPQSNLEEVYLPKGAEEVERIL